MKRQPKPGDRGVIPLNDHWCYRPDQPAAWHDPATDDIGWEAVRLPHTNRETPADNFSETLNQFLSAYRLHFASPELAAEQRAILHFEGVMCAARVWVNGCDFGEHRGGYTPFSLDITDALATGGGNLLAVGVDSRERPDIPPFGHVIDYLSYGGIYREVWLEVRHERHITSLGVSTFRPPARQPKADPGDWILALEIEVDLGTHELLEAAARYRLQASLGSWSQEIPLVGTRRLEGQGATHALRVELALHGVAAWDVDQPTLHGLELALLDLSPAVAATGPEAVAAATVDRVSCRVGFREIAWKANGFWLNGRRLKLRGLNRHQSWPYVGYAMPARAQRADADMLRHHLGCNVVRQSHYPQSRHFLDRCDEIGLLVFAELPGWQHIGDQAWQDRACDDLAALIRRDRIHPSVIIWGVRINESADNESFYRRTNQLAHRLDPTRATGGVRNFGGSQLLEDVYTYNDFVHSGDNIALEPADKIAGRGVPYLVSEHNGHMFPTKKADPESRRLEQALRHARVLDAAYGSQRISGAIGWCQFDYHTHGDFGSGDHVCHHGVQDMFRLDKPAAALYASQQDGRPFGRVASAMCNGDHDGASIRDLVVFTNSDEVRVFKGERLVGSFFPDRRTFRYLPHPPVRIGDLIGDAIERDEGLPPREAAVVKRFLLAHNRLGRIPVRETPAMLLLMLKKGWRYTEVYNLFGRHISGWGSKQRSYRFEGWSDGVKQWQEEKGPSHTVGLSLSLDADSLHEDATWDSCRVEIRVLDALGNQPSYCQEPVTLEVTGPLAIIGPATRCLVGGSTAFWVRTIGQTGTARISAQGGGFRTGVRELMVD